MLLGQPHQAVETEHRKSPNLLNCWDRNFYFPKNRWQNFPSTQDRWEARIRVCLERVGEMSQAVCSWENSVLILILFFSSCQYKCICWNVLRSSLKKQLTYWSEIVDCWFSSPGSSNTDNLGWHPIRKRVYAWILVDSMCYSCMEGLLENLSPTSHLRDSAAALQAERLRSSPCST